MIIILLGFSFLAGLITILSPCILSIAPILLSASAQQSHYKPLGIITGLIISFSFFTLSLTALIQATGISPDVFRYSAIIILIFFGLTMIFPALENAFTIATARIVRLGSDIQEQSTVVKTEFLSGFILGVALGLVWTPCAGPILATITALAATNGVNTTTILVTLAYAIGAAIPMLLICLGGEKISRFMGTITPYSRTIRAIFGIVIIASAFAMIFHIDTAIQQRIAPYFPSLSVESHPTLLKELNMLKNRPDSTNTTQKIHAPELVGITDWINSQPLSLEQLRGQVVLLDFWTYTCINCIRTLPHIEQWYETYKDKNFVIIGVHTPEFAFEKSKQHVEDAIKRFHITYPVALDSNYKTWQAYDNHYWPAHYLIDQQGIIVKSHFGEGDYMETENSIRTLLNLPPLAAKGEAIISTPLTPETYLGLDRGNKYHPELTLQKNTIANYNYKQNLTDDHVGLKGQWITAPECIKSQSNTSTLELNFVANKVYLVMQAETPQLITVLLDGKPVPPQYRTNDMNKEGKIKVHEPRMYNILDLKNNYGRHTLSLQCQKGVNAYVFTFGGVEK